MISAELKDRYLTTGWNNLLTAALGLPAVVFAAVALATSTWSDRAGFAGFVVLASVY